MRLLRNNRRKNKLINTLKEHVKLTVHKNSELCRNIKDFDGVNVNTYNYYKIANKVLKQRNKELTKELLEFLILKCDYRKLLESIKRNAIGKL